MVVKVRTRVLWLVVLFLALMPSILFVNIDKIHFLIETCADLQSISSAKNIKQSLNLTVLRLKSPGKLSHALISRRPRWFIYFFWLNEWVKNISWSINHAVLSTSFFSEISFNTHVFAKYQHIVHWRQLWRSTLVRIAMCVFLSVMNEKLQYGGKYERFICSL